MSRTLRTSCYLTVEATKQTWGWELQPGRLLKRVDKLPSLANNEVPIRIDIELPQALFDRPELSVSIAVNSEVPRVDIDADTMENMSARLQEVLGLPVTVTVDLPADDTDQG